MYASLLGLTAALVAGVAIVLVRTASGLTRRNAPVFAAFAGGVVISLALLHLIPEAMAMVDTAPWLVLAGFAAGFVLHGLLGGGGHSHGSAPAKGIKIAALTPVIAIALHSALDGAIYAVTFAIDTFTGFSTAVGLIIHEFPEALICFVLLQRAGFSDRSSAVLAFMASGLTTFGFAAGVAPFAGSLDESTLGVMFAFLAGVLLHVGAAHLLHEAHEAGTLKGVLAVLAGGGIAVGMTLSHSGHHHHGYSSEIDHGHGSFDHENALSDHEDGHASPRFDDRDRVHDHENHDPDDPEHDDPEHEHGADEPHDHGEL